MISMLQEPFMSGDLKYLIMHKSFSILKEQGYSDESIAEYKFKVSEAVAIYHKPNDFMG